MSNDLNTALSDAIKQHLPEVAAKELRVHGNGYSIPGHIEERHQFTTTNITHE